MNSFLSCREACLLLGVSYPNLLRLIKTKKIPALRIGKGLRIPLSFINTLESDALASIVKEGKDVAEK